MTQGDRVSLKIFNVLVDAVVRLVMLEVLGHQEAYNRFIGVEGEQNIILYVDDGNIVGHNLIWSQTTLPEMVRMLERVGLLKQLVRPKQWFTPQVSFGVNMGLWRKRGEQRERGTRFGGEKPG